MTKRHKIDTLGSKSSQYENAIAAYLTELGIYYRRQVVFDNNIRADFTLVGLDIVIEIDGAEHTKLGNKLRDQYFNSVGFTVIHIDNTHIYDDRTRDRLKSIIRNRQQTIYNL